MYVQATGQYNRRVSRVGFAQAVENRQMRRPPIPFPALCVIARELLIEDPRIDDSEWRERIKCRLLSRGWRYPIQLEQIGEAMRRVEQTIPRTVPVPPAPTPRVVPPRAPSVRSSGPRIDRSWTSLADLIDTIQKRRRRDVA